MPHRFMIRSAGRRTVAVTISAFLIAGLTACGGGSLTVREDLIMGRDMDVTTLDPNRSLCDTCQIYNGAVYDTMIKAENDGSLTPLLAESWEANADNTIFTFTLRPEARFADGSPVEAKDVKWSWERIQHLKGSPSYFMDGITTVEAPDPQTVVVTSEQPNSAFFNITTAGYMGILNSDLAAQHGATADPDAANTDTAEQWFMGNSAGAGQYELESYQQGTQIVLKRNDNYWGTPAAFPRVTIKQVKDSSTQLQQLQQGDVDVAQQLNFDAIDQIESDANISSTTVPTFNFVYLGLGPGTVGGEALKDRRVRDAVRKGIDYDSVINATVAGKGKGQATGIPAGFPGADGLPLPGYDPEGARKLLADAGVDGLRLEAVYPNFTIYGVNFNTMFQSIQQSLKTAGIDLTLTPLEFSSWSERLKSTGMPVTAVYFAPDHPDAIQYLQYFAMIDNSVWMQRSRMPVNPAQNTLTSEALRETGAQRDATYSKLAQMMWDDAIILPIVNPDVILANSPAVTGNNYHITRNVDLSVMGFEQ
ncbi:ABC transporter substrate-binding protein [Mycobacterium sp. NPDC003449]